MRQTRLKYTPRRNDSVISLSSSSLEWPSLLESRQEDFCVYRVLRFPPHTYQFLVCPRTHVYHRLSGLAFRGIRKSAEPERPHTEGESTGIHNFG